MNQFFKNTLILVLFALCSTMALSQKFVTHSVKDGETLAGIARQYKVTTANILSYNKEVSLGETLRPNTILVIPVMATSQTTTVQEAAPTQDEPIGFTSHKVRRKETIYGITKRYNITENQLKKYNRTLYSARLKKKMILRIPKYRRITASETISNEDEFETYTVAAKETRWSIAHDYGITLDSLVALNPDLAKDSSYLAEGQELKMPIKESGVKNQVTQLFIPYTVPAKMNFYQLEKKFHVKPEEIVRLNPEITERGGLKEGMVIRIPEIKVIGGDINTDNYNFYDVKPKQTEYSLTRKLGISYRDLLDLNPDLKKGLKAGMVLKLPKDQQGDFEVRNALVLDKINLLDSINSANKPKIMFLLPFRLNKLNLSDAEATRETIEDLNSLKYSLGLYSGALVALDSIASLGISVEVHTFDNQLDSAKTREILLRSDLKDYDAIIGPLDVASLREVALRCAALSVPVIAPVPVKTNLSISNLFFSYTPDDVLRKRMLDYVTSVKEEQNIIIIADSLNERVKDSILSRFPDAKIARVIEERKNIGVVRDNLRKLLSDEQENWVFVESSNYKLISSVTSILNSFQNALLDPENEKEKLRLRMFTTNKNNAFESEVISGSHLSHLNFTYPSVYRGVKNNSFSERYRKRFGENPDRYAVRGFDLTYDLLLKLAYKNDLIYLSRFMGETEYTGNKFSYEKSQASGYFNQASYIMSYNNMRIEELK